MKSFFKYRDSLKKKLRKDICSEYQSLTQKLIPFQEVIGLLGIIYFDIGDESQGIQRTVPS